MGALAHVVVWLNAAANAVGYWILAPIAFLPGWLSATLVGALSGIAMVVMFKYTSNQRAFKAAQNDIKAQLLALKLFKENIFVALRAQGRLIWGAVRLFCLALLPVAIMALPVTLIIAQVALWYQARPLRVGEEAVLTMKLGGEDAAWPTVYLEPTDAVKVTTGPLRILSKRELSWLVQARANGTHQLHFRVNGQQVDKELASGDGFMRVSLQRPGWHGPSIMDHPLLNPWEAPLESGGAVEAITIAYPDRPTWMHGTDSWFIYWFLVAFVVAFIFGKILGVNLGVG